MTPISPDGDAVTQAWRQALEPGPQCLALERLGEPLTESERTHVAGCARCQTELELFAAYDANEPMADEGLSVAWIAAQAKRRVAPATADLAPAPVAKVTWGLPQWLLAAASLAVILGGAVLLRNPAPTVDPGVAGTAPLYRAGRLEVTSPVGDVAVLPAELRFTAVPGAVEYEVRLLEVDGTELWRATTPSPAVTVPANVTAFALPAKTLVWRVVASDARQRVLAESGEVRVRVQPR